MFNSSARLLGFVACLLVSLQTIAATPVASSQETEISVLAGRKPEFFRGWVPRLPINTSIPAKIIPTADFGLQIKACGSAALITIDQVTAVAVDFRARVPDGTMFWALLVPPGIYETPYDLGWITVSQTKGLVVVNGPASWSGMRISIMDMDYNVVAESAVLP